VAARLLEPGGEWAALRALQLTQFTTPVLLFDDDQITRVVAAATGLEARALLGMLDAPEAWPSWARPRITSPAARMGSPTTA
jgi:hypothetical protein